MVSKSSPPGSSGNDKPDSDNDEFKAANSALEQQIVLYNDACARKRAHPDNPDYQAEVDTAAKNVISALRKAADLHPDPSIGAEWHQQADKFFDSSMEERENTLKEIGKGLLKVILAPLALAGLGIYTAGEIVTGAGLAVGHILTGVGSVLKGIGKLGKEALLGKK